jgi:hypothetical protein
VKADRAVKKAAAKAATAKTAAANAAAANAAAAGGEEEEEETDEHLDAQLKAAEVSLEAANVRTAQQMQHPCASGCA